MPWSADEESREWHPATDTERCYQIEKGLQDMGLDVELVELAQTKNEILKVACIFDGPDADPNAERWKSFQEKD